MGASEAGFGSGHVTVYCLLCSRQLDLCMHAFRLEEIVVCGELSSLALEAYGDALLCTRSGSLIDVRVCRRAVFART